MQNKNVTEVIGLIVEVFIKLIGYIILVMVALFIALLAAGYVITNYMIPDTRPQHSQTSTN